MDYDWLGWVCLLPPLTLVGLAVLGVAINLWEKHAVRPFDLTDEGHEPPATAYSDKAAGAAEAAGYEYAGAAADNRGGLYGLVFEFWASPDRAVAAVVASGRMAGAPANLTYLYSVLPDDRYLLTSDDAAGVGLPGLVVGQVWLVATFDQLHDRHHRRLREPCGDDRPAAVADPVAGFVELRERTADWAVARGRARYTDDDRATYRCTLRGAVWLTAKVVVGHPLVGLAR